MPCTFTCERPAPYGEQPPGCQFTNAAVSPDLGNDQFCAFHLPSDIADRRGARKGDWADAEEAKFGAALDRYIADARNRGRIVDLTGLVCPVSVTIDGEAELQFLVHDAIFSRRFSLQGATLDGETLISESVFRSEFAIRDAALGQNCTLAGNVFEGPAAISDCRSGGGLGLDRNHFAQSLAIESCACSGLEVAGSQVAGPTIIRSLDCEGKLRLSDLRLGPNTRFEDWTIAGFAHIGGVMVGPHSAFDRISIARPGIISGLEIGERSRIAAVRFEYGAAVSAAKDAPMSLGPNCTLTDCEFGPSSLFRGLRVGDGSRIAKSRFGHTTAFRNIVVGDGVSFQSNDFGKQVTFKTCAFGAGVTFDDSRFGDELQFEACQFGPDANFTADIFGDRCRWTLCSFGPGAGFVDCKFGRQLGLADSVFLGPASFAGAAFAADLRFDRATFEGDCDLSAGLETDAGDSMALRDASFRTTTFKGRAIFRGRRFLGAADFHGSRFHVAPEFFGAALPEGTTFQGAHFGNRKGTADVDAAAYQILQDTMERVGNRREQRRFFGYQQDAMRRSGAATGFRWIRSYLYKLGSNYGQSLARPVVLFVMAALLPWLIYSLVLSAYGASAAGAAFFYAADQFLRPFWIWSPTYDPPPGLAVAWNQARWVFILVGTLQSIAALAALAFFILSLRWRLTRD
ncbi:MAG: hypothetical protein GY791_04835 [Alphaproteobacteria bacterium]|nr:hypothetical protein [Alphaproteobacteria bacterium]